MRALPQDIGILHFIGVGGIGMSGIAEVLLALGYKVQGSDISDSANVKRLKDKGIEVMIGHAAKNIESAAVVIISSAIKQDNAELIAAKEKGLPIVRRAEMLAELMRLKWAIAIAGTHGKTTTTSMVGAMLEESEFDPTVINGGIVNRYGTNTRLGNSDWMVVEADESDGTFTKLPAAVGVVTNIDPEHLDHYGSFDAIKEAFKTFILNLPFYGYGVLCSDHPEVQALIPELSGRKIVTYGFNPQAQIRGHNIRPAKDGTIFDVDFDGEAGLKDVFLPMFGDHNVQNSLAALAIAREMDIPHAGMKNTLKDFSGVKRRFTKTGEVNDITIIDDYGHHPVEIKAVLKAARQAVDVSKGKVIAVMQPHRYTRLDDLFDDFCTCFNDADTVFIADVYAAGEDPIEGADKQTLAKGLTERGHKDANVLEGPQTLAKQVGGIANSGDYIICLGAGDITKWAYALPEELNVYFTDQKKRRA